MPLLTGIWKREENAINDLEIWEIKFKFLKILLSERLERYP